MNLPILVPSLFLLGLALGLRAGLRRGGMYVRRDTALRLRTISAALLRGGGPGAVKASDALRGIADGLEALR